MNIRPVNLEEDYPKLLKWWEGHGSHPMPSYVFPQGWMVESGGVEIAASFLYLDVGGRFAVVEFLTTNPAVAFSRTLVQGVKELIGHIEGVAKEQGCKFIVGFVSPNTGEERLMQRIGYVSDQSPSHKLYAKNLCQ